MHEKSTLDHSKMLIVSGFIYYGSFSISSISLGVTI